MARIKVFNQTDAAGDKKTYDELVNSRENLLMYT